MASLTGPVECRCVQLLRSLPSLDLRTPNNFLECAKVKCYSFALDQRHVHVRHLCQLMRAT